MMTKQDSHCQLLSICESCERDRTTPVQWMFNQSKRLGICVCVCFTDMLRVVPGSVGCTRSDPELIKNRGGGRVGVPILPFSLTLFCNQPLFPLNTLIREGKDRKPIKEQSSQAPKTYSYSRAFSYSMSFPFWGKVSGIFNIKTMFWSSKSTVG